MPFTMPGKSLFWRPSVTGMQEDYYNRMTDQMNQFKLADSMKFDPTKMLDPYYQRAQEGVGSAYEAALQGLTGSGAWGQLGAGSGANRGAFNFALGQQKKGAGALGEELARINALNKGGWDISGARSGALAEIAPEVNAAGQSLWDSIQAAEASGVRGGALDAMKYAASRDAGTAMGNALQEAIRGNRQEKVGIGQTLANMQNLTLQDPQSMAMAQMLAQLYGQGAGAMAGLAPAYMQMGYGGEIGNLDRSSDLYKYLQQMSWGGAMGQSAQASKEGDFSVGVGPVKVSGNSDERIKTPPDRVKGALSSIRSLPVYDYQYNDKAEELGLEKSGTPGRGVMAQDLEKIPSMRHLVHKGPEGYRKVDVYGLTATALAAVKELDKKLDRLAASRRPRGISGMRFAHA